jgi:hypothetical protein
MVVQGARVTPRCAPVCAALSVRLWHGIAPRLPQVLEAQ